MTQSLKTIAGAMTLAVLLCASLSACSSPIDNNNPIGVGTGPNSLKYSPCR